jgi:hypothetical protein
MRMLGGMGEKSCICIVKRRKCNKRFAMWERRHEMQVISPTQDVFTANESKSDDYMLQPFETSGINHHFDLSFTDHMHHDVRTMLPGS